MKQTALQLEATSSNVHVDVNANPYIFTENSASTNQNSNLICFSRNITMIISHAAAALAVATSPGTNTTAFWNKSYVIWGYVQLTY